MFTFMFTTVSTLSLLSHLRVFSRLSSLSNPFNFRFLTFLALASRLLLILGFDMELFHLHKHHTGSDLCPSIPLSVSVLSVSFRRFLPAPLYFVIVAWCRCSPLSVILLFLHPLHASFVRLLPFALDSFSFLFHSTSHFHPC